MFLCRTGRLSAAALDHAFKSPGSFLVQVKANRLRHVTLTLRKGHKSLWCRSLCVDSTLAHLGKQQADPHPVQNWESSSGFVFTDWGHWDRVATIATNLSKSVPSESSNLDIIKTPFVHEKRRYSSRGEAGGNVLFTGNWGVSSRRCSTRTMHTRASSTAAAAKKSDAGEEQTTGSNKGDELNLKDASTTSSSTEKAPGEAEPEGGKPSKTQQLKKVFKEYGAVGVSFHICISLMSLGMFYLLISSGIDMAAVLCKVGFSEAVVRSKMAAGTSTFVLAYAIHKLFAPLRISITLVSVPLIVRYFRKTGLFKPPTPAP
ncbi:protein FAM210B, mitochondrial [Seriola lalandi dorsalis]|uniref:Family with sequence similarity 210 member B n=1 Tax=Seriola lalandi dorsalis TaxID=1841481 RepID=A0A3B4WTR2_SERLL|nr:protein FAM210B, mitochondrial [Seriola lalandi dorsalis]XP_056219180.1 protein FAM210B, mitochondrial [Seriola aureovittata]